MEKHYLREHGLFKSSGISTNGTSSIELIPVSEKCWVRQHIQTFFNGLQTKYFPVIVTDDPFRDDMMCMVIKSSLDLAREKDRERMVPQPLVQESEGKGELSPTLYSGQEYGLFLGNW